MESPEDLIKINVWDVRPLATQVAGHTATTEGGNVNFSMLKHKDGYVLKPFYKLPQGMREKDFYESLPSAPHSCMRQFVPRYFGTAEINVNGYCGKVLILEDVVKGFEQPCIMDVKIGRQTWDPNASQAKRESEDNKYKECKKQLGFCIPGFQVYNAENGELTKYDKNYGRVLNKDTVKDAFGIFFNIGRNPGASSKIIGYIVSQLESMLEMLTHQTTLHLYSSSVLLAYDCTKFGSKEEAPPSTWICTKMIDFAHAFTSDHPTGKDENYCSGLSSLINVLRLINNSQQHLSPSE